MVELSLYKTNFVFFALLSAKNILQTHKMSCRCKKRCAIAEKRVLKPGFVPSTLRAFPSGEIVLIKSEQLEKLGAALNCTPNDLLEWQPDAAQTPSETHSINGLKKNARAGFTEDSKRIPPGKFEQILDILQALKNKPGSPFML